MTPVARHGLLVVAALVAVLPALGADVALYIDNAPHLAELDALAEAWPSPIAWSDHQAGMVVGLLNGQAAWWPLAGLVRLGLPAIPIYIAAIALSNVVFVLGVDRLGQRLLNPKAALAAAILAGASVFDLYGIAGATGGMWPFRLACGLLLYGIGARWRSGVWLAIVCLLHTFVAIAAVLVTLVFAIRDRRRLIDLAIGLVICAGWWVPLLDPALRGFPGRWSLGPADAGLLLMAPFEIVPWLLSREVVLLGGPAGLLGTLVVFPLAAWGLRSAARDRRLALELTAVVAVFVVGALVLHPLTEIAFLGPNPWRHLIWWRVAVALSAGAALATLPRSASLVACGMAVVGAVAVGAQQIPIDRELRADLDAVHALVQDRSRVFHEDTFQRFGVTGTLANGHGGALLGTRGPAVLGSWYAIAPVPTIPALSSESGATFGVRTSELSPDAVVGHLKRFSADAAVTTTPELAALFAAAGVPELGRHGPFVAWELKAPLLLGARGAQAQVLRDDADRVDAAIHGGADFLYRRAYHPWWTATFDEQPIELVVDPQTGLQAGTTPGRGRLSIRWEPQPGPWWLAGVGLLAALAVRRLHSPS